MRIAVFTPYLPYPPDTGGKIRSHHLLRALTARFEVDLYSSHYGKRPPEAGVEALERLCHRVVLFHLKKRWRTRDRIRRTLASLPRSVDYFHTLYSLEQARRHLANGGYDLVIADEICMTPYAELAPNLPGVVTRQKVDHLHYLETARARRWGLDKVLDLAEGVKLRRYEREKMPFYQACLACSEQDALLIRRHAPGIPVLVVPNGADLSKFVPSGRLKAREPTLLYVGSMHYYPNIDAVQFFFEEMYESIRAAVPALRVQIVGHAPPSGIREFARLPGVEVTGSVPDVRAYYEQATVFMTPLRLGGGTRLKIVEAMAMGLPVVSTTVGAEGLDIHPGEDILIADDAASFAGSVVQLLSEPALRNHIVERGQLLASRYDWRTLTKPYPDLVEAVAKRGRQGRNYADRASG
jgi:glycosyltransferase involved in cell wall biosynthesis